MNPYVKLLWDLWGRQKLVREVKHRALAAYMQLVRGTRSTVITVLLIFFVLQSMIFSAFGVLITGILLWDHDFTAKIEILFWIFAGTFSVPAILLVVLVSESLWFRVTGAKHLMDKLDS